jgi:hypothetical protein
VLGVSVDTARRRVRRGELDAIRVPGPHGAAWHVRLPAQARIDVPTGENDAQARPGVHMAVIEASIEPTVQALLVYLRERDQQRDREVADLHAELADVRAVLSTRDQELGAALERIRALEAPREADPSPEAPGRDSDAAPAETAPEPPATSKRAPWWRRWFGV